MIENTEVVALPPGWKVVRDSAVGVSMMNENGHIVGQHPYDSPSWRKMVLAQRAKRFLEARG